MVPCPRPSADDTLPPDGATTTIPAPPPSFDDPADAQRLFGLVAINPDPAGPDWHGFASDSLDEEAP